MLGIAASTSTKDASGLRIQADRTSFMSSASPTDTGTAITIAIADVIRVP